MDTKPYLTTVLIVCAIVGLCACSAAEVHAPEGDVVSTKAAQVGQSWDFIDSQNVKDMWRRADEGKDSLEFTLFKASARDAKLKNSDDKLEITTPSNDHVLVMRRNSNEEIICEYTGHIWVETDLESYDGFSEHTDPNQRPTFYRIVKGTYQCLGMEEPITWAAKINE